MSHFHFTPRRSSIIAVITLLAAGLGSGARSSAQAVATTRPTTTATVLAADPYGFLGWLNSTRASYGLRAVGYDPNLSNWAAVNNSHQASRGMGHFVMGPS